MRKSPNLALLALAVFAAGCSVAVRDPNMYAQDTQKVLETRNDAIKSCYDQLLKADAKVAGTVTVKFTVKTETGDLTDIAVDPANTNAPEALSQCVVTSIQGLQLSPADDKEGLATFSWVFQPGAPGAAVSGPAAPPPAAAPAAVPAAPAAPAAAVPAAPKPAAAPAAPAAPASAGASVSVGISGPTRAK